MQCYTCLCCASLWLHTWFNTFSSQAGVLFWGIEFQSFPKSSCNCGGSLNLADAHNIKTPHGLRAQGLFHWEVFMRTHTHAHTQGALALLWEAEPFLKKGRMSICYSAVVDSLLTLPAAFWQPCFAAERHAEVDICTDWDRFLIEHCQEWLSKTSHDQSKAGIWILDRFCLVEQTETSRLALVKKKKKKYMSASQQRLCSCQECIREESGRMFHTWATRSC